MVGNKVIQSEAVKSDGDHKLVCRIASTPMHCKFERLIKTARVGRFEARDGHNKSTNQSDKINKAINLAAFLVQLSEFARELYRIFSESLIAPQ
jgi:hypothetical protein